MSRLYVVLRSHGEDLFRDLPADTGWPAMLAYSLSAEVNVHRITAVAEPRARAIVRAERDAVRLDVSHTLADALATSDGGPLDVFAEHVEHRAPPGWQTRPRRGLRFAEYGAGTYVCTGLSLFRAIPEAEVGAFKLFLNLLNLEAG